MDVADQLTRLVAAPGDRIAALVRRVCAQTLGLPPLPAAVAVDGPVSEAETVAAEFAEQFSVDVARIDDAQRACFLAALGADAFAVTVQIYLADWLPRLRAGLAALGLPPPWPDTVFSDHVADPAGTLFTGLLPAIARLRALDPVTAELVRLRGAGEHHCRLCQSLREATALDGGGSESLYDDIARFETSTLFSEAQKAALRYVDALIWSPAQIPADVAAGVRRHFTDEQAAELTLDVLRNASNKIAVALSADGPRVADGTERYLIGADGQTVFG